MHLMCREESTRCVSIQASASPCHCRVYKGNESTATIHITREIQNDRKNRVLGVITCSRPESICNSLASTSCNESTAPVLSGSEIGNGI